MATLKKDLEKRELEGNYRVLKDLNGLVDFSSNDYLGLASNVNFGARVQKRISTINPDTGAKAARLISGNSKELVELENKISKFHGADEALVFSTGYLANLALFSSIGKRSSTVFYDELSHASIKDGIRLGFAKSYPFLHNDLKDLERKLKHAKGEVYIAVEALYSMDGDFAPLKELNALCERYSLNLIVDEAHTNGIYGENGSGKVKELNLEREVFARIVTFGKSLGAQGGAVIGSQTLKDYMINFSRPFIYSTAISPYLVLLIDEAYNALPELSEERKRLFKNINFFNENTTNEFKNEGPVQAVRIKGNLEAKSKAEFIQSKGFDVRAVLSPTVKKGQERLRVCLHSFNSEEDIKKLTELINNA